MNNIFYVGLQFIVINSLKILIVCLSDLLLGFPSKGIENLVNSDGNLLDLGFVPQKLLELFFVDSVSKLCACDSLIGVGSLLHLLLLFLLSKSKTFYLFLTIFSAISSLCSCLSNHFLFIFTHSIFFIFCYSSVRMNLSISSSPMSDRVYFSFREIFLCFFGAFYSSESISSSSCSSSSE